jgi:hypothetical protein
MPYQGMTGQGTTAVLTTNAITGCVRSLTLPELTQDKIDASCLDTTGFMKYIPGDLTDPGECQLEIIFDPTFDFDAIVGVLDTLTITFGIGDPTNTINATLIGTGFITNYSLPDLSTNNLAVVNVTFAFDGDTGPAFTVES